MQSGMQSPSERYQAPLGARKSVIVHTNTAVPLPAAPKTPVTKCVPVISPNAEICHPTLASLLRTPQPSQPVPPLYKPRTERQPQLRHPLQKTWSATPEKVTTVGWIAADNIQTPEVVQLFRKPPHYTAYRKPTVSVESLIQSTPALRRTASADSRSTAGAIMESVIKANLEAERERALNNYSLLQAARQPDTAASSDRYSHLQALLSDKTLPKNVSIPKNFVPPSTVTLRPVRETPLPLVEQTRKRNSGGGRTVAELIIQAQQNSAEQMEILKKTAMSYSNMKKTPDERVPVPELSAKILETPMKERMKRFNRLQDELDKITERKSDHEANPVGLYKEQERCETLDQLLGMTIQCEMSSRFAKITGVGAVEKPFTARGIVANVIEAVGEPVTATKEAEALLDEVISLDNVPTKAEAALQEQPMRNGDMDIVISDASDSENSELPEFETSVPETADTPNLKDIVEFAAAYATPTYAVDAANIDVVQHVPAEDNVDVVQYVATEQQSAEEVDDTFAVIPIEKPVVVLTPVAPVPSPEPVAAVQEHVTEPAVAAEESKQTPTPVIVAEEAVREEIPLAPESVPEPVSISETSISDPVPLVQQSDLETVPTAQQPVPEPTSASWTHVELLPLQQPTAVSEPTKREVALASLSSEGFGQALVMDDMPLDLYSIVKRRHASSSSAIIQNIIDENIDAQIRVGMGENGLTTEEKEVRNRPVASKKSALQAKRSNMPTSESEMSADEEPEDVFAFSQRERNTPETPETDSAHIPLEVSTSYKQEIQMLTSFRTNITVDRIAVISDRCALNVLPETPMLTNQPVKLGPYRIPSLKEMCSEVLNRKEKKPAHTSVHVSAPLSHTVWNARRAQIVKNKTVTKKRHKSILFKRPKKKQAAMLQTRKPFLNHCPFSGLQTISPFLPPAAAQYVQRALEQELSQRKSPAHSRNVSRAASVIAGGRTDARRSNTPIRSEKPTPRQRSLRSSTSSDADMPDALPEFDGFQWIKSKSFGMPLPDDLEKIFTAEFVEKTGNNSQECEDIVEFEFDAECLAGSAVFLVSMADGSFGIVSVPETKEDDKGIDTITESDMDIYSIPPLRIVEDFEASSSITKRSQDTDISAGHLQQHSPAQSKTTSPVRKKSPDYVIVPTENDDTKITIKVKHNQLASKRQKRRRPTGWDHERPKKRKKDTYVPFEPEITELQRQSVIVSDPYEFPGSPKSTDGNDNRLAFAAQPSMSYNAKRSESPEFPYKMSNILEAVGLMARSADFPTITDIMEATLSTSNADLSTSILIKPSSPTESATKSSISDDDDDDEDIGKLDICTEPVEDPTARKVSISLGGERQPEPDGSSDDSAIPVVPAYEFNRYETVLLGAEIDMQSETSSMVDSSLDLENTEPVLISIPDAGEATLDDENEELIALLGSITEKTPDHKDDVETHDEPPEEKQIESDIDSALTTDKDTAVVDNQLTDNNAISASVSNQVDDNSPPVSHYQNVSRISSQFSSKLLQLLDVNNSVEMPILQEERVTAAQNTQPAADTESKARRRFRSRFGPPLDIHEKPLPVVSYDIPTELITEHIKALSSPRPPLLPTPTIPPVNLDKRRFPKYEPYKRNGNWREQRSPSENFRPKGYRHRHSVSPYQPREPESRYRRKRYNQPGPICRHESHSRNNGNTHYRNASNTRFERDEFQFDKHVLPPVNRTKLLYPEKVYCPAQSFESTQPITPVSKERPTKAHCVHRARNYVTDGVLVQEAVLMPTIAAPQWLMEMMKKRDSVPDKSLPVCSERLHITTHAPEKILPESYELLKETPYGNLIVESIKCAKDNAGFKGFAVQFKGFPSIVALPVETMETYFLKEVMQYYEKNMKVVPESG